MVIGADGALYFLLDRTRSSFVWKLAFDETGTPQEPVASRELPGKGISLAMDPLSGSLFALVRERLGDTVVLELSSAWLSKVSDEPVRVLGLEDFARETMEGGSQDREQERKRAASMIISIRLPTLLLPETLDFLAFDNLGFLYLGARDKDLVLKFDLDQAQSSRYIVNVAAAVESVRRNTTGLPNVRLQAWRKSRVGS